MTNRANKHWLLNALLILIIICLIFVLVFVSCRNGNQDDIYDKNAIVWDGEQKLPSANINGEPGIAVPGFKELVFLSAKSKQRVNFYNPSINTCDFKMSLYANEELLWQSEKFAPGTGFHEINIDAQLKEGNYNGKLYIECYRNGQRLSSTPIVNFTLIVINK